MVITQTQACTAERLKGKGLHYNNHVEEGTHPAPYAWNFSWVHCSRFEAVMYTHSILQQGRTYQCSQGQSRLSEQIFRVCTVQDYNFSVQQVH